MRIRLTGQALRAWTIGTFISLSMAVGCAHIPTSAPIEDTRWADLFDGQSLAGWQQVNGTAPYHIENGAIRGTNVLDSPNSFLATTASYSDFVLEFQSRSFGNANSGLQFRTEAAPGTWSGVIGYQLDIDPTQRRWTGGIYHEGVHLWRHSMARNPACQAAYQHEDWNTYRIEAIGSVIATWVNDVPCAHMVGDHHAAGFIALQVHAIGQDKSYIGSFTEWRHLRILQAPTTRDLWLTRRAVAVEGWLADKLSQVEIDRGWQAFDFSERRVELDMGSGEFELVVDIQMDDAAEGYIDYVTESAGISCAGRYNILNDVTLGDRRPASHLIGGMPDTHTAKNLSELGRPKRVYTDTRWNRLRLVVTDNRIQHWLNGVKLIDYPKCISTDGLIHNDNMHLSLVTLAGRISTKNAKFRTEPNATNAL